MLAVLPAALHQSQTAKLAVHWLSSPFLMDYHTTCLQSNMCLSLLHRSLSTMCMHTRHSKVYVCSRAIQRCMYAHKLFISLCMDTNHSSCSALCTTCSIGQHDLLSWLQGPAIGGPSQVYKPQQHHLHYSVMPSSTTLIWYHVRAHHLRHLDKKRGCFLLDNCNCSATLCLL